VNPLLFTHSVFVNFRPVKSGGRDDCRRHIESEKHSRHSSSGSGKHPTATVQKLTSFFPSEKPSEKILCPWHGRLKECLCQVSPIVQAEEVTCQHLYLYIV
jgi:hypothetical protein